MQKANPFSICEENNFDQIYQDQMKGLYHFIYYKCGNASQAEDIVQEAFLKLWENCAKVKQQTVKGFLYKTAKNLFLNRVNRLKVALKFEHQIILKPENEHPEFLLEQKEFQQSLQNAIGQLPENQRVVFLMNRIDQLKYREIAEILDISQKAVEKRMHHALLALRKLHRNI